MASKEEFIQQCMADGKSRQECEDLWSASQTPTDQVQQTREEFMTACLADGTAREVCEARWKASREVNPTVPSAQTSTAKTGPPSMGDLLHTIEMLEARLKVRERQLKQAINIANTANQQSKAKDAAQKQMLVDSIQLDSHFTKDELQKKNIHELQTIRLTLDKSMEKTFASVAAEIDAAKRTVKPQLTAGAWDREKKRWVGGS